MMSLNHLKVSDSSKEMLKIQKEWVKSKGHSTQTDGQSLNNLKNKNNVELDYNPSIKYKQMHTNINE